MHRSGWPCSDQARKRVPPCCNCCLHCRPHPSHPFPITVLSYHRCFFIYSEGKQERHHTKPCRSQTHAVSVQPAGSGSVRQELSSLCPSTREHFLSIFTFQAFPKSKLPFPFQVGWLIFSPIRNCTELQPTAHHHARWQCQCRPKQSASSPRRCPKYYRRTTFVFVFFCFFFQLKNEQGERRRG